MAKISQDVIDNIRNNVNIVDVISHYIPLTKKGRSFKCVCPFHDDHDPSLSISEEKQIFHCFVCGEGGNVFSFVQKYEHVSFVEAVVKVGELANIHVDIDTTSLPKKQIDPKIQGLYNVLNETMNFCCYELNGINNKNIKNSLHLRGINDTLIERFNIGYNPKEDRLYKFLHAKKYSDENIIDANLCWLTERGMHDVFSNRIMIPIHDKDGKCIGFTARRTEDNQIAKYINTSETAIYHKGNTIFNYHRAKDAAKKAGKVYLVEGAMDVIAYAKVGIDNAVATLGTACTKEQIQLLKQLNVPVIVSYDGDKAGQEATYKFYKNACNVLEIQIINNKYGLDPDEIIDKYGKDELVALSNKTISWIDFLFDHLQKKYDLENYSDRKEYAKEISNEIKNLNEEFEKQSYYIRLQQLTGFDMRSELKNEVPKITKKENVKPQVVTYPIRGILQAQYQILSQMLVSRVAMEKYRQNLGFLLDSECNALALYIVDYYRSKSKIDIAELIDYIKEDNIRKLLLFIDGWELRSKEYDENILLEAISKMKNCMVEEKIRILRDRTNMVNDPLEKAKIAQEIIALKRNERGD